MRHRITTVVIAAVLALGAGPAFALERPSGTPVLNQAQDGVPIVKSDATQFTPTRGIYIGDAAACNIAIVWARGNSAVTLPSVQPGASYPFSIKKLMSTNTTCTSVHGLY